MTDRIRSAIYSNIHVYEMSIRGTPVMIRKSDGFVNATQILRAAGLPKPARTKVLEKEVSRGVHEKVQGGYAGSQGTWIPLDSAIALAQQYHVYEDCAVLFHYDMASGAAEAASPPMKPKKPAKPYYDSSSGRSFINVIDEREKKRNSPSPYVAGSDAPAIATRPQRARSARKNLMEQDDDAMLDFDDEYSSTGEKSRKRNRKDRLSDIQMSRQDSSTFSHSSHPDAGKICQNCGVTDTPQWRRGPSGKRTLCNACGVKWSSGRLHLPTNLTSSTFPFSLSESENNLSEAQSTFEEVEVGTNAWKIQLEVSRMKSKLRETEKGQKKLTRLLSEAHSVDREVDRCYRKILSSAKKSLPKFHSPKYGKQLDNLFHKYEDEFDADLEDEDLRTTFGNSGHRDNFLEHQLITRFVKTVKNHDIVKHE